jgi:cytochrome c-type biogenesis protein CcmH/NrfF
MVILMIIYAILYNVVYNAMFIDIFTDHMQHFEHRAIGTFLAAAILTGITLFLWWIPFLILLGLAAYAIWKKKNTGLGIVLVVLAIIIAIAGHGFKKQSAENDQSASAENTPAVSMMLEERSM